jgi:hypothetical protein
LIIITLLYWILKSTLSQKEMLDKDYSGFASSRCKNTKYLVGTLAS